MRIPAAGALAERQSELLLDVARFRTAVRVSPAGRRKDAAPGRRSWVLLDVALPRLLPHTRIIASYDAPQADRTPRFPLVQVPSPAPPCKGIPAGAVSRALAQFTFHFVRFKYGKQSLLSYNQDE